MGQTWRAEGSAEVVMICKSMPGSGAMEGGGAYNRQLAPMRIAIDISARVSVRVGRLLFVIPICQ
jgi:hypothetical protein